MFYGRDELTWRSHFCSDNKTANKTNTTTANTTPAPAQQQLAPQSIPPSKGSPLNAKKKESSVDVDKMITRKVDIDYIPGLDDDFFKVILPGKFLGRTSSLG